MDAESPLPDPDDPFPSLPTLPPLSLFFPEVTDEEAKCLDGETVRIAERRARVMALYRRGLSMETIRKEVGCSIGTVHHDIHTVLEGYRRLAGRETAQLVADALQRLTARETDIEREWEKSKGELTETATSKRDGRAPQASASVKKKQRYGDPRLSAQLLQCWDRRCRLLRLLNDDDLKGDGLPPVKLVAGLDPAELV